MIPLSNSLNISTRAASYMIDLILRYGSHLDFDMWCCTMDRLSPLMSAMVQPITFLISLNIVLRQMRSDDDQESLLFSQVNIFETAGLSVHKREIIQ